jgi:hypothetical protein
MNLKTYEFDVVLRGVGELAHHHADALFASGCDDGTPASSCGTTWIHFDREASSLEDAIRLAIGQIRSAGFQVSKVELDAGSMSFQEA